MTAAEALSHLLSLAASIAREIAKGGDDVDKRVNDIIPGDTQLHLMKLQKDAEARAKFGELPERE